MLENHKDPSAASLRFGRNQIKTRATTDRTDFTDKTGEEPAQLANRIACAGSLHQCHRYYKRFHSFYGEKIFPNAASGRYHHVGDTKGMGTTDQRS
jgi:hypothetical protein